jgi:hypothetical protein
MPKVITLFAFALICCFIACKKETTNSTLSKKIIGNWLVVGGDQVIDTTNGIYVQWAFYYVNKVGINTNNTFTINTASTGTWKLTDSTIKFYSIDSISGTIYKDTTAFTVSVTTDDKLILRNGQAYYQHKRLN